MARNTSIISYNTIKASGLLSKLRWSVYDHIFHHGPTTARKTWLSLAPKSVTGSISTRFKELKTMGLIDEVGKIKDETTGMSVILWDVTSRLPEKITLKKKRVFWIEITSLGAKFVHEKRPSDCPRDSVLIKVKECVE